MAAVQVNVLFFASIREAVGVDRIQVAIKGEHNDIAAVIDKLCQQNPCWAVVIKSRKVLAALNQEMAHFDSTVSDGDEIALFPPVTGG